MSASPSRPWDATTLHRTTSRHTAEPLDGTRTVETVESSIENGMSQDLQLYIYTSRMTASDRSVTDTLTSIRREAQAANMKLGISGVLIFHEGRFLQVLEGEPAVLTELMERISRDTRHTDILCLVDQAIDRRSLAEWNMETFDIGQDAVFSEAGLEFVRDALLANVLPEGAEFVRLLQHLLSNRRMVELIRLRTA